MTGLTERWLIDRDGRHWCWNDARLAEALGTTLRAGELADFAVTNLGFVDIRYSERMLRIRCRPRVVTQLSLGSLCYFLFDYPWSPVAVSLLARAWRDRIFADREQALDALTRIIPAASAALEQRHGRFMSVNMPEGASPLCEQTRLGLAALAASSFDGESLSAVNAIFSGRWSITHIDLDTDRFDFDFMGPGFTLVDPAWSGGGGFRPVATFHDRSYLGWVESSRRDTLLAGRPVFEKVDALVDTSDGLARLRYHRVTVPLQQSGSRCYVLSASVDDSAIDLRKAV